MDGDSVLDAMFVKDDGVGLNADDAKRSYAVRQELVICACGELVCILIVGSNKWRSAKEYILTWSVNWSFAHMVVIVLFVTMLQLSRTVIYFCLQSADEGF